jgi:hypothetical protein
VKASFVVRWIAASAIVWLAGFAFALVLRLVPPGVAQGFLAMEALLVVLFGGLALLRKAKAEKGGC